MKRELLYPDSIANPCICGHHDFEHVDEPIFWGTCHASRVISVTAATSKTTGEIAHVLNKKQKKDVTPECKSSSD